MKIPLYRPSFGEEVKVTRDVDVLARCKEIDLFETEFDV